MAHARAESGPRRRSRAGVPVRAPFASPPSRAHARTSSHLSAPSLHPVRVRPSGAEKIGAGADGGVEEVARVAASSDPEPPHRKRWGCEFFFNIDQQHRADRHLSSGGTKLVSIAIISATKPISIASIGGTTLIGIASICSIELSGIASIGSIELIGIASIDGIKLMGIARHPGRLRASRHGAEER